MELSSLTELYPDRDTAQAAADYVDMAGGWQEPGLSGPLEPFKLEDGRLP